MDFLTWLAIGIELIFMRGFEPALGFMLRQRRAKGLHGFHGAQKREASQMILGEAAAKSIPLGPGHCIERWLLYNHMKEEKIATAPASSTVGNDGGERASILGWITVGIVLVGLLIQLWLESHAWIGGDQVALLRLGRDFVTTGVLHPVAKSMSGGGAIPGSLLQILIGAPLAIWSDYRAPSITLLIFDLAAVILIYRVGKESLGSRFALLLVALYWLSPWRTYHSGFVWEPSFLFLPAALHFWSCWRLRNRAEILPSIVLAACMLFALQIHGSFLVLVLSTLYLLLRRTIRIHPLGALLGVLVGGITLIPTLLAYLNGTLPSSLPREGYVGYGLVHVAPVLKGALYWFRLGALDIGDPLKQTVFLDDAWISSHPAGHLAAIGVRVLQLLLIVTIGLSLWASWWLARGKEPLSGGDSAPSARGWLRSYAASGFVALVLSAALAPFTLQGWHVIVALHAASIPAALWGSTHWSRITGRFRIPAILLIILQIAVIVTIGLGNAIFRRDATPRELYQNGNFEQLRPILPAELPQ